MYIKKLVYQNVGPIEDATIEPGFNANGTPKPLILVGENGTGKSTILSNIVDSFYEMAGKAYGNACKNNETGGHQYFKTILPGEIRVGKKGMFSCVLFQDEDKKFPYFFKSGDLEEDFVKEKLSDVSLKNLSWKDATNYKEIRIEQKESEKIFGSNVICYFGPDRYEKPEWMGDKYYENIEVMHPVVEQRFNGVLRNAITVKNVSEVNLQWLLDVIADSRADVSFATSGSKYQLMTNANLGLISNLISSRNNLEKIMTSILGTKVSFRLNPRNAGGSRFQICKDDGTIVSPSLDALSTGQIALFNLFATIIRYADNNNIYSSVNLETITGIVVIDEIELHLHSKLQKEVLPKLIKLFPKVQFIITSHSPLFVLGMQDTFGDDGFEMYELPDADKITAERFSEFGNAFHYYQETSTFDMKVSEIIEQASNKKKVLVITEGASDWKHLEAAYEALKAMPKYSDIFEGLDFDLFKYEDPNSNFEAEHRVKMGCYTLKGLCSHLSLIAHTTRYIFIADSDNNEVKEKLSKEGSEFKKWGNNVYSLVIPTPESRGDKGICIEHLYTDAEIKTEYRPSEKSIAKRLYLGCEFDENGKSEDDTKRCSIPNICGKNSIAIIDGSGGKHVTRVGDEDGTSLTLSKNKFACLVLHKTPPFDNFDFTNFLPIFKSIKDIINDK